MREYCTICNHADCGRIEAEVRETGLLLPVAAKYGVGAANLHAHMRTHAAPAPASAPENPEPAPDLIAQPADFQAAVARLAQLALQLVEAAVHASRDSEGRIADFRHPARALHEAVRQLGFVARIFAPHKKPKSVQEKFIHTAEWGRIRTLILEAIWPFPDARAAVSAAMEKAQAA